MRRLSQERRATDCEFEMGVGDGVKIAQLTSPLVVDKFDTAELFIWGRSGRELIHSWY
jgi:hypothetical protein